MLAILTLNKEENDKRRLFNEQINLQKLFEDDRARLRKRVITELRVDPNKESQESIDL